MRLLILCLILANCQTRQPKNVGATPIQGAPIAARGNQASEREESPRPPALESVSIESADLEGVQVPVLKYKADANDAFLPYTICSDDGLQCTKGIATDGAANLPASMPTGNLKVTSKACVSKLDLAEGDDVCSIESVIRTYYSLPESESEAESEAKPALVEAADAQATLEQQVQSLGEVFYDHLREIATDANRCSDKWNETELAQIRILAAMPKADFLKSLQQQGGSPALLQLFQLEADQQRATESEEGSEEGSSTKTDSDSKKKPWLLQKGLDWIPVLKIVFFAASIIGLYVSVHSFLQWRAFLRDQRTIIFDSKTYHLVQDGTDGKMKIQEADIPGELKNRTFYEDAFTRDIYLVDGDELRIKTGRNANVAHIKLPGEYKLKSGFLVKGDAKYYIQRDGGRLKVDAGKVINPVQVDVLRSKELLQQKAYPAAQPELAAAAKEAAYNQRKIAPANDPYNGSVLNRRFGNWYRGFTILASLVGVAVSTLVTTDDFVSGKIFGGKLSLVDGGLPDACQDPSGAAKVLQAATTRLVQGLGALANAKLALSQNL